MLDLEQRAKGLYSTYCEAVGGDPLTGQLLPKWEDLAADPEKQVQVHAWREVARFSAFGSSPVRKPPIAPLPPAA